MIYGVNFGGPAIPDTPRSAFRKFKPRVTVTAACQCHRSNPRVGLGLCRGDDPDRPVRFLLVGIGQSEAERDRMLQVAHNGKRRVHVESRQTVGGTWYGIYVY